jgi:branched-chain amino acid transport system ATP-binding protein
LHISGLQVRYRGGLALNGIDLTVPSGSRVAIVGRNGAGKSSLVKAIAGRVPAHAGRISWQGRDVTKASSSARVRAGISLVPEGRQIFPELTVAENLRVGGFVAGREVVARREQVYETFPALLERCDQAGSQLSGGEAQMLAIGQALMAGPSLLMLDEPSLGLAPVVVTVLLDIIRQLCGRGMTVLLVEQSVRLALALGGDVYVLDTGELRLAAAAGSEVDPEVLQTAYLGGERR